MGEGRTTVTIEVLCGMLMRPARRLLIRRILACMAPACPACMYLVASAAPTACYSRMLTAQNTDRALLWDT